jgi:hypothetical protein
MKNEEDHFDLLRKIQKQPDASQRDLARELGFSYLSSPYFSKYFFYNNRFCYIISAS